MLDVWLQESRVDGIAILEIVGRARAAHVPVVMISGHGTIEMAVGRSSTAPMISLRSRFNPIDCCWCSPRVGGSCTGARKRRTAPTCRARGDPDRQIAVIAQLRSQVERVAPTGSRVLISGPAGSGKEVVARMIHARSRRSSGPFVVMNCATLNPARFGRRSCLDWKPAAIRRRTRAGPVCWNARTAAHCCWMSAPTCRLETRARSCAPCRIRRSSVSAGRRGSRWMCGCCPRPIATCRRKLPPRGFVRICIIASPWSRSGAGLAGAAGGCPDPRAVLSIARSAESSGIPARTLSADTLAALQAYDWPGNVRQLRNLTDWLLIMAPGGGGPDSG